MKKLRTRALSWLLTLAMLFSMLPISARAEDNDVLSSVGLSVDTSGNVVVTLNAAKDFNNMVSVVVLPAFGFNQYKNILYGWSSGAVTKDSFASGTMSSLASYVDSGLPSMLYAQTLTQESDSIKSTGGTFSYTAIKNAVGSNTIYDNTGELSDQSKYPFIAYVMIGGTTQFFPSQIFYVSDPAQSDAQLTASLGSIEISKDGAGAVSGATGNETDGYTVDITLANKAGAVDATISKVVMSTDLGYAAALSKMYGVDDGSGEVPTVISSSATLTFTIPDFIASLGGSITVYYYTNYQNDKTTVASITIPVSITVAGSALLSWSSDPVLVSASLGDSVDVSVDINVSNGATTFIPSSGAFVMGLADSKGDDYSPADGWTYSLGGVSNTNETDGNTPISVGDGESITLLIPIPSTSLPSKGVYTLTYMAFDDGGTAINGTAIITVMEGTPTPSIGATTIANDNGSGNDAASGKAYAGDLLTVSAKDSTSATISSGDLNYAWTVGGVAVSGNNSPTYTVQSADELKTIRVTVTPKTSSYTGSGTASVDVLKAANYSFTLSADAIASAYVGYTATDHTKTITITNTGDALMGLTVSGGTGSGNFNFTQPALTALGTSGTTTFTVTPKSILTAGTYTGNFAVTANGHTETFKYTFTVNAKKDTVINFTPATSSYTYDGNDHKPTSITVTADTGTTELTAADYNGVWTNSAGTTVTVLKNADTYTYTVTLTATGEATYNAPAAKSITITKKAAAAAPGLTPTSPTTSGGTDGSIKITSNYDPAKAYEYSTDSGNTWHDWTTNSDTQSGLGAGSYIVRAKYDTANEEPSGQGTTTLTNPTAFPVTVAITKDGGYFAAGTDVTLKGASNYSGTLDATGNAVINNVPNGTYTIEVAGGTGTKSVTISGGPVSESLAFYTLTVNAGTNGSSPTGGGVYIDGSTVTVGASANTGWVVSTTPWMVTSGIATTVTGSVVTVKDTATVTAQQTAIPVTINTSSLTNVVYGNTGYSVVIVATGGAGAGSYTYTLVNAADLQWLTLNTSTGAITINGATANVGTYTLKLTASSTNGQTSPETELTLSVTAAQVIVNVTSTAYSVAEGTTPKLTDIPSASVITATVKAADGTTLTNTFNGTGSGTGALGGTWSIETASYGVGSQNLVLKFTPASPNYTASTGNVPYTGVGQNPEITMTSGMSADPTGTGTSHAESVTYGYDASGVLTYYVRFKNTGNMDLSNFTAMATGNTDKFDITGLVTTATILVQGDYVDVTIKAKTGADANAAPYSVVITAQSGTTTKAYTANLAVNKKTLVPTIDMSGLTAPTTLGGSDGHAAISNYSDFSVGTFTFTTTPIGGTDTSGTIGGLSAGSYTVTATPTGTTADNYAAGTSASFTIPAGKLYTGTVTVRVDGAATSAGITGVELKSSVNATYDKSQIVGSSGVYTFTDNLSTDGGTYTIWVNGVNTNKTLTSAKQAETVDYYKVKIGSVSVPAGSDKTSADYSIAASGYSDGDLVLEGTTVTFTHNYSADATHDYSAAWGVAAANGTLVYDSAKAAVTLTLSRNLYTIQGIADSGVGSISISGDTLDGAAFGPATGTTGTTVANSASFANIPAGTYIITATLKANYGWKTGSSYTQSVTVDTGTTPQSNKFTFETEAIKKELTIATVSAETDNSNEFNDPIMPYETIMVTNTGNVALTGVKLALSGDNTNFAFTDDISNSGINAAGIALGVGESVTLKFTRTGDTNANVKTATLSFTATEGLDVSPTTKVITLTITATPLTGVTLTSDKLLAEPKPGDTLTANITPDLSSSGLTSNDVTYKWFSGGVEVNGESGSTYQIKDADEGKIISVEVAGKNNASGTQSAATSAVWYTGKVTVKVGGFNDTTGSYTVVAVNGGTRIPLTYSGTDGVYTSGTIKLNPALEYTIEASISNKDAATATKDSTLKLNSVNGMANTLNYRVVAFSDKAAIVNKGTPVITGDIALTAAAAGVPTALATGDNVLDGTTVAFTAASWGSADYSLSWANTDDDTKTTSTNTVAYGVGHGTVAATLTQNTYTVVGTVTQLSGGGTLDAVTMTDGSYTYTTGSSAGCTLVGNDITMTVVKAAYTIAATPHAGTAIISWTVNGSSVTAPASINVDGAGKTFGVTVDGESYKLKVSGGSVSVDSDSATKIATKALDGVTYGYGAQGDLEITVENIGNMPLYNVTLSVTPSAYASFTNDADTMLTDGTAPLAVGAGATFKVTPNTGMNTGTHTYTLTLNPNKVSGDASTKIEVLAYVVSLTVSPLALDGTAAVTNMTSGTAVNKVGDTLSAAYTGFNSAFQPTDYVINWYSTISGSVLGTGATYAIQSTDQGKTLYAKVEPAQNSEGTYNATGSVLSGNLNPVEAADYTGKVAVNVDGDPSGKGKIGAGDVVFVDADNVSNTVSTTYNPTEKVWESSSKLDSTKTYKVQVKGTVDDAAIILSAAKQSVTLDYYTVTFGTVTLPTPAASTELTVTMEAKVGGNGITTGDIVYKSAVVTFGLDKNFPANENGLTYDYESTWGGGASGSTNTVNVTYDSVKGAVSLSLKRAVYTITGIADKGIESIHISGTTADGAAFTADGTAAGSTTADSSSFVDIPAGSYTITAVLKEDAGWATASPDKESKDVTISSASQKTAQFDFRTTLREKKLTIAGDMSNATKAFKGDAPYAVVTVTNTGNVALTGVKVSSGDSTNFVVSDASSSGIIEATGASLAVGSSVTFTITRQTDLNANAKTANLTFEAAEGLTAATTQNITLTIMAIPLTSVTLSKTADINPGDVLTATIAPSDKGLIDSDVVYTWTAGGTPVGTNSKTYQVQAADAGKVITVSVSPDTTSNASGGPVTASTDHVNFTGKVTVNVDGDASGKGKITSVVFDDGVSTPITATLNSGVWESDSQLNGEKTYMLKVNGDVIMGITAISNSNMAVVLNFYTVNFANVTRTAGTYDTLTGAAISASVTTLPTGFNNGTATGAIATGTIVPEGTVVTFAIDSSLDDKYDYKVTGWSVAAASGQQTNAKGAQGTVAYASGITNGTVTANLAQNTYTVTGSVTPTAAFATVTISGNTAEGVSFSQTIPVENGTPSFISVPKGGSYTINYVLNGGYTSANPEVAGKSITENTAGAFNFAADVSFTISGNAKLNGSDWATQEVTWGGNKVAETDTNGNYSFTVTADVGAVAKELKIGGVTAEANMAITGDATKDYTFYTVTVVADANGNVTGSDATTATIYKSGASVNLVKAANAGYQFKEWTATNGHTVPGSAASNYTVTSTGTGEIILTAKFEANTYTVTYNGNGSASGSTADSTYTYDVAQKLTKNGYAKTGYTFTGWDTDPSGTTVVYTDEQSVMNLAASGTVTLYAVWTANTYTVTYNGNGSTNGSTADSMYTYDVAQKLTKNGYAKTGYTFAGWDTNSSGTTVVYTDEQSVTNLAASGTVTLYAVWTADTYTVTYMPGTNGMGSQMTATKTHDVDLTLKGAIFTRTGYTQTGWATSDGAMTNEYALDGTYTGNTALTLYPVWTADTYTVTYMPGTTGTGSQTTDTKTHDMDLTLEGSIFTRTGYTQTGWATSDGGVQVYGLGGTYTANTALTLYPVWTADTYTVTYMPGIDGTGSQTTATKAHDVNLTLKGATFTRTGYTQTGWATSDGGVKAYELSGVYGANTALTLYPVWTANTYIVAYSGNGSTSGSTADSMYTYDVAQKLSKNGYAKTGYTFAGWDTNPSGTTVVYTDEQSVTNLAASGTVTLYAVWTADTYTVTYNGNGSTSGSTADSTYTYDVAQKLTKNGYAKTGYTFTGWDTDPSGTTVVYTDEQSVTNLAASGTVTLYAVWTANTYTVTYNGNGSTSGSTADSTYTYDVAQKLTKNGYAKTGYTFDGWDTNSSGTTVVYTDEQSVKSLAASGAVTLYAVWTADTYTVTYMPGTDGTGSQMTATKTHDVSLTLEGAIFTRTGYTQTGWATSDGAMANEYALSGTYTGNTVLTLYPVWTADTYTVTYMPGTDGTGSQTTDTKTYDVNLTLKGAIFTRTGYTQTGWATSDGSMTNEYALSGNYTGNTALTLYPVWTADTYTVTYKPGTNGTGSQTTDAKTHDVNLTLKGATFTRTGYTQTGWATSDGAVTNEYALSGTYTGNTALTLYPVWTANGYTVKYDGNGADGGTAVVDSSHVYGAAKKLNKNTYEKAGYTFDGWDTNPSGATVVYTDEQSVTNLATSGTVTLYAVWSNGGYTVKYDSNGATGGSTENSKHDYDMAQALTKNGYAKTGYTFAGWDTNSSGTTVVYTDEQSVMNLATSGTVTLYAVWTANTYTVAYNGNGSTSGSTASGTHTYGVAQALTKNGYAKTGYTFAGWDTNSSGTTVVYTDEQSVMNLATSGTVTLYAVWTANTYTVAYNGNGSTSGSTASGTHTYGVAQALTKNGYAKTGYTFAGWDTNSSGTTVVYTDEQSVTNLATSGTVTLYAVWTANTYTVAYNGNGSTSGSTASGTHTYDAAQALTKNGYAKTGYTFAGWDTNPSGTTVVYTDEQSVTNLATSGTVTLYAVWTADTYTVTYKPGTNGTGSQTTATKTHDVNLALKGVTFTRTGYTQTGWATSDGGVKEYELGDTYTANTAIELYPVWTADTYTVTYKPGTNGTGSQTTATKTHDVDLTLKGATFTRTGYTQTGWATSDGGVKAYELGSVYAANTAIDLYPVWTADTYTVTYKPGINGTGSQTTDTKTHDMDLTLEGAIFTRTGYMQTGWATSDGGVKAYELGGVYAANTTLTLYPVWTANTYTVTYKPGTDGTGSQTTVTKTHDMDLTLEGAIFTRTGYTQTGWATSDGGVKAYELGSVYAANTTLTLYPVWTADTYTVTYKPGTNGTGSQTTDTKTHDMDLTLEGAIFTRTGYTQTGWATSDGAMTNEYALDGTYTGNTALTLYPVWTADTYVVTYKPGTKGTGTETTDTKTHDMDLTLKGVTFTHTGYTQTGWATSDSGVKAYELGSVYTANTTLTLYPVWTANTYTVAYNGNGSTSGSTASGTHTYDAAQALTKNGYAKTGYTFAGWDTNSSGTTVVYTDEQSVMNLATSGTVTLYAVWTADTYTVTYKTGTNGTGSQTTATKTHDVNLALKGVTFTRTGYTQTGWATSDGGVKEYELGDTYTANTAIELYPVWTADTYTVTYKPGTNGTGSQTTATKTHDVDLTLKGATFTRTGYTQTGWATSDGGVKAYELGSVYAADTAIDLYPVWTADTYTVTYKPGINGTGSQTTDTKTHNVNLTLKGATFTRTGYTQTGWATSDGGIKAYELGGVYAANTALTLYPVWTDNTRLGVKDNIPGAAYANSLARTGDAATTYKVSVKNMSAAGITLYNLSMVPYTGSDFDVIDNMTGKLEAANLASGDELSDKIEVKLQDAKKTVPGTYTVAITVKGHTTLDASDPDYREITITYTLTVTVSGGGGGGGATQLTVTYDLIGKGTSKDALSETVASGGKPASVPTVTPNKGYTFKGWSQDNPGKVSSPKLVDPKTVVIKENTTFYAVYVEPVTGEHEHYIKGYDTGIFGPADNITRSQVAAIIARACLDGFHEDTDYGNGGYTDVADDHWARSAIAFVTTAGVFEGDGEGHFDPDRPITRQEFALVFARMVGLLETGEMPFSDADTTADWAITGVYTAYAKGWVNGYEDGTFKPWNNIARSEAVKIVNRYLGRGVDAEGIKDVYSELKQWPDVPSTYWAYYEILEASNDHTYFYVDGTQPPEMYTKAYIEAASWGK